MANALYSVGLCGGVVEVSSPYSAKFVEQARKLRGKFSRSNKSWLFPARYQERVEALCADIWGAADTDMVTVEMTAAKRLSRLNGAVRFAGTLDIARAWRSGKTSLSEGVAMLDGSVDGIDETAGYRTVLAAGSVVELRMPRDLAERGDEGRWDVRIIEAADPAERITEIRAEKERLVAKLTELDAELAALEAA